MLETMMKLLLNWFSEHNLPAKDIELAITFSTYAERQAFNRRLSRSMGKYFNEPDGEHVVVVLGIPIHLRVKPRCPTCGKLS